jgi:hypothetical protein
MEEKVETLVTVVAALPDVALHLEVAVLSAEVHIGRKHHLRIAFFHGDGWGEGEGARESGHGTAKCGGWRCSCEKGWVSLPARLLHPPGPLKP